MPLQKDALGLVVTVSSYEKVTGHRLVPCRHEFRLAAFALGAIFLVVTVLPCSFLTQGARWVSAMNSLLEDQHANGFANSLARFMANHSLL